MADKKSSDITDELFQESNEERKGNNEIKFNFFSPKKSNIQSGNRANTSPSSSVDEFGGNENPMIVTQLLKTQQELGLTKIRILEFQSIL
ncbi:unnamed protein product [Blepharisma stoltei]|uniref:Uncharacterized protein n=1 Tax=Blepharisma stoltei TaxID=1481888 RepID=A0AAU9JI83_9CILI|nr:unnamed protein product [Blepharisma stoltei]